MTEIRDSVTSTLGSRKIAHEQRIVPLIARGEGADLPAVGFCALIVLGGP